MDGHTPVQTPPWLSCAFWRHSKLLRRLYRAEKYGETCDRIENVFMKP